MDMLKEKKMKKNFIVKTWERCLSKSIKYSRSKSCNCASKDDDDIKRKMKYQVAPEGCFSVYVGPEKKRFIIRTKYVNHPLFEMLLEDAEMEYGYNSEGPILLPCEVDLFYKVLAEMEMGGKEMDRPGCGFAYVGGSCSPFNPTRRVGNSDMAKGYGSYGLLTPSRLIKMNQF